MQSKRIPRKKKKFLKKGGVILYKDTWISIKHGQTWCIKGVEMWKEFYSSESLEYPATPKESYRLEIINFNKDEKR
jgi:hypothetical protein